MKKGFRKKNMGYDDTPMKGTIMLIALRNLLNLGLYLHTILWILKHSGVISRKIKAFIKTT